MNHTPSKGLRIKRPRLILICMLAASLALLFPPHVAHAANYAVTKTADTNDGACDCDCSLREALAATNMRPNHDTIRSPTGTYTLMLGQVEIASNVRLRGSGAASTIIDGSGKGRVLAIIAGNVSTTGQAW